MTKRSAKSIFLQMVFSVFLPVILLALILTTHSIRTKERSLYEKAVHAASEAAESIDASLSQIAGHMDEASSSMDFLLFSNKTDRRYVQNKANSILSDRQDIIFSSPEAVAILLYNTQSQNLTFSSRSKYGNLRRQLCEFAEELGEQIKGSSKPYYGYHNLLTEDTPYIIYASIRRYGMFLTVIDPTRNARFRFYNQEKTLHSELLILPDTTQSGKELHTIHSSRGGFTLSVRRLSQSDRYLSSYGPILAIFLLIIILVLFQLYFLSEKIVKPLNQISEGLQRISEDRAHRLPDMTSVWEIEQINTTINQMLDQIKLAQENAFNSRMDAIRAKIQFLQIQIRPHFFLNCLKNMNSLLTLQKYEEAAQLNYYLSEYIAYTFNDTRNFVPLRTELTSVKNYVDLYSLLSYQIHLRLKLTGLSADAQCLPMTILTFVENSIKHTKNLKNFEIRISTDIISDNEGTRLLRTLISDNGGGFPDSYLEEYAHADPSRIVFKPRQIGISNVRYRLWLIYGEKGTLRLFNEENEANVEILYPFESLNPEH